MIVADQKIKIKLVSLYNEWMKPDTESRRKEVRPSFAKNQMNLR